MADEKIINQIDLVPTDGNEDLGASVRMVRRSGWVFVDYTVGHEVCGSFGPFADNIDGNNAMNKVAAALTDWLDERISEIGNVSDAGQLGKPVLSVSL